ncbi:MAG TPA: hypothetical protein VL171_05835 [Verrucomicrobiae bacterium]|nr:hypothetical protein [Verrucomicrobiae bacterium]
MTTVNVMAHEIGHVLAGLHPNKLGQSGVGVPSPWDMTTRQALQGNRRYN